MQERGELHEIECRGDSKEKKKENQGSWKRKMCSRMKWMIFLIIMLLFTTRFVFLFLRNMELEKKERQAIEGRQLCMAVSALFREKVENIQEEEELYGEYMLEFVMDIYWRDIGDASHPLYGSCPSSWEAGGKITGMVINEAGELLEITYESPRGKEEIWVMHQKDGELAVEVLGN